MHRLIRLLARDLLHRHREARGEFAILAEDREFLDHKANIAIRRDQLIDLFHRLAAIGAAVVKEFHHRDIALGIAPHP